MYIIISEIILYIYRHVRHYISGSNMCMIRKTRCKELYAIVMDHFFLKKNFKNLLSL